MVHEHLKNYFSLRASSIVSLQHRGAPLISHQSEPTGGTRDQRPTSNNQQQDPDNVETLVIKTLAGPPATGQGERTERKKIVELYLVG